MFSFFVWRPSAAPHPQHDAVLDVEQDLLLLAVVPDEGVQRVAVRHPANQARVGGQRDDGVALDAGGGKKSVFLDASGPRAITLPLYIWSQEHFSFAKPTFVCIERCATLSTCAIAHMCDRGRTLHSAELYTPVNALKHFLRSQDIDI